MVSAMESPLQSGILFSRMYSTNLSADLLRRLETPVVWFWPKPVAGYQLLVGVSVHSTDAAFSKWRAGDRARLPVS